MVRIDLGLVDRHMDGAWTLRCDQNLLYTQQSDSQSNLCPVPVVPIADEITGSLSVCECLYDLLRSPSSGWMLGHIEMQQLATIVFQDDQ